MLLVIGFAPMTTAGSAPLRVLAIPTALVGMVLLAAGLIERGHQHGTATGPLSLPSPHTA